MKLFTIPYLLLNAMFNIGIYNEACAQIRRISLKIWIG